MSEKANLKNVRQRQRKKNEYESGDGERCQKVGEAEDRGRGDAADEKENLSRSGNTEIKSSSSKGSSKANPLRGSFWLTRIVLVRYMGFIYFVAFLVSLLQNSQLMGKNGLLPADHYLDHLKGRLGSDNPWYLTSMVPTLLWFVDYSSDLDKWLQIIAVAGMTISAWTIVVGSGNWPLLGLQWMLYHSLVNVGQRWFSFGWESQILETGFLTIFLCPALSLSPVPEKTPSSKIVLYAYRWLIFQIMLGAGLIKIRGDKCWQDLTCMNYHYQTQPVPNPVSYFLHQSPEAVHKLEVLANHFIELVAPFFLLLPHRGFTMLGGAIQIFFQVVLIISGNLSYLNWLTIVPSLACFDDASLQWMFSNKPGSARQQVMAVHWKMFANITKKSSRSSLVRRVFNLSLGALLVYLSVPVVMNLLSSRQAMNTSFDPLRLVNTYGAFGSVTKKRTEVILQGTTSSDPNLPSAVWEEYEFKCKPGRLDRRPCLISPYHYRLDWLMWFAAFQDYQHNPWMLHLIAKLLHNDPVAEDLIAYNPFHGREPPKFIRAEHYSYYYTKLGSDAASRGQWWRRKRKGSYLIPISMSMLDDVFKQMGWPQPVRPDL